MVRTDLANGVSVWYDADPQNELVLRYPDGSTVRVSAEQFSLMQKAVENLRDAYECLLGMASGALEGSNPPIEQLMRIDDLLFALGNPRARSADTIPPCRPETHARPRLGKRCGQPSSAMA